MRFWGCLAALWAVSGYAQDDVVPLKSGRVIVGKISQKGENGVVVDKWDGSGSVSISWSQIPEKDLPRFKEMPVRNETPVDVPSIEGVRLVTSYRIVDGIIDREDATTLWLKTRDGKNPIPFAKNGIEGREKIMLRESDIYTPDEILDARIKKAADSGEIAKPDTLIGLGDFAMSQADAARTRGDLAASEKMVNRALSFYADARTALETELQGAADEAAKSAIQKRIDDLDRRIKEFKGRGELDEILKLVEKNDYDKALEKAQQFLTDYEGTPLAEKNLDLVDRITREQEEFKANRDKILGRKIVDAAYKLIGDYLRKAASDPKIDSAMKSADGVDQRVINDLKDTYKITQAEFQKWWSDAEPLRAEKKRRANLGTGTWILKGGQNGGFDSGQGQGGNRPGGQGGRNPLDDFRRRVGGNQPVPGMPQPAPQADQRKKLQTKDEWWTAQTASVRQEFLEGYWATKSSLVQSTRKETEKKCTMCNGQGTLKAQRYGQFVDVVCQRCHGSQVEIDITYY
jgi:hypothetical protein